MAIRHYNIPIFIPELACPFQCVFCNQEKISGTCGLPSDEEIRNKIDQHLGTINHLLNHVEVAFFGGNFTGLSYENQRRYLEIIQPYIETGLVKAIRISTRPDYITAENLAILKQYNVKSIELGVQSTDPGVLEKSGRGHSVEDVFEASTLVKQAGFELGLQMMTGLPGDTEEKALRTASEIIAMGASTVRIYPVLVIRNTALEIQFRQGLYKPQTLEEAIGLCAKLYALFIGSNVRVIRMGLHPSENLINGEDLVAGPFHPSFGEMVKTGAWLNRFRNDLLLEQPGREITIQVAPREINAAIGYRQSNRRFLEQYFHIVKFIASEEITGTDYHVDYH